MWKSEPGADSLVFRLYMRGSGACDCGTKIYQWQHHSPVCLFRLLTEAAEALRPPPES